MPDSKITALTSISTSTDPANDPLVIVDVSDTSMAATGTTKKVTLNQLLGASGTATLASATISGDLTVDTSTLKVDSTNNRVGINTATPSSALEVVGSASISGTATSNGFVVSGASSVTGAGMWGLASALAFNVNSTEGMRLNSTGLGVGTSSHSVKLGVVDTGNTFAATFKGNGGTDFVAIGTTGFGASINGYTAGFAATADLILQPNGGNVGIGVTPSAGKGCLQLSSGINFPATQVASTDANTLDDYEEGTFTPTIIGLTTAGTGTYTSQVGRYTKIGNLVTVQIYFYWTNHTGTGNMAISGLPFNLANVSGLYGSPSFGLVDGVSLTAGKYLGGYGNLNSDRIILLQYPTGGGAVDGVPVDTAGEMSCSMTYRTA